MSFDKPSSDGEPIHENGISDVKDPGKYILIQSHGLKYLLRIPELSSYLLCD